MSLLIPKRKTFRTLLTALVICFAFPVRADDKPIPRLPRPETFDQLEARLFDLKESPFAASAATEIRSADLLISQGRLFAAAGKLRQAGTKADLTERTLALICSHLRNAALKQSVEEASEKTATLRRQLAVLKSRLHQLSIQADLPPTGVGNPPAGDALPPGDAP